MALADGPNEDTKMRLYLASAAINVLDRIVPLLPQQSRTRTACYITTAGNLDNNPHWIDDEIRAIENADLGVTRIDLAELSRNNVADAFSDCGSIWVGGGNTYLLLQEVRRTGFDDLVIRMIEAGIPYIGTSAGSLILAPNLECIRFAEEHPDLDLTLKSFDGLNVFPLLPLVHFDNPDYHDIYSKILAEALENNVALITLRDNQFIFVDGENWRVIDSD